MIAWPWVVIAATVGYGIGYGYPEIIVRAVRKVRASRDHGT